MLKNVYSLTMGALSHTGLAPPSTVLGSLTRAWPRPALSWALSHPGLEAQGELTLADCFVLHVTQADRERCTSHPYFMLKKLREGIGWLSYG